jgi:hypothetical protein
MNQIIFGMKPGLTAANLMAYSGNTGTTPRAHKAKETVVAQPSACEWFVANL